jgi:hypothetical protein
VSQPDKPEMPAATKSLGPYPVPPATMKRLKELQAAVRAANHTPPGKGLLLSALLYSAYDAAGGEGALDGDYVERDILGPYLRDHPEEEKPR